MTLQIGDVVEHEGKRYTLMLGPDPRRMHEMQVMGHDNHPDHDGFMAIDDAIDLGLKKVGVAGMSADTYLFTDTESTRFPYKGGMREGQARVCQLAFIYTDADGKTLAEFSSLIKPDGWEIKEDAQKIHGITLEDCEAHGIPSTQALALFRHYEKMATKVIAHGEQFDRQMMDIEQAYASNGGDLPREPWHCTMRGNAHFFAGKWPKLAAALEFFTGRILGDDAHDAMHDVRACRDIFFAARAREAA